MKKIKYILFTFSVIIVFALGILIYIFKDQSKSWYCSPTKPRGIDQAKWQEAITPKTANIPIDQNFFNKFVVASDANNYSVKYPASINYIGSPFPYEIREMTAGKPLEIGGGTLEFYGLGVAICDANHISTDNVSYQFFDAQFSPVSTDNVKSFRGYREERSQIFQNNPWPFIQFWFEYQGVEDLIFNGITVFDARTHKEMSRGYSSGGTHFDGRAGHRFRVYFPLWHKTPVDIVIDVSFGPTNIHEFLPKIGEGFKEKSFECRLIGVFDGIDTHGSSSTSSGNMIIEELPKAASGEKGTCFFFACQPAADQMPVTFSFLGTDGKELSSEDSYTSDYTQDIRLGQPLEKVALIRAKYRTNRYRIIIHLPYIPGLPEQNHNINDLFDVYIPYVKLDDAGQVNDFLYKTLQLGYSQTIGPRPANNIQNFLFPIEFREVTVRDIAKLYATGGSLNANIEKDQLELEYPMPFLTKMKMLLKKLLQK